MKDDKKALVLFSGGKDSLIVTLRLLDSNYKVYLVTYENGCGLKIGNVNNTCEVLAEEVSKQVHMISKNGYEVIAILGIEQSPSCCVNYIYTNFFISSKALASWSGQEVALSPQRIPFNLFIASSIFIP